MSICETVRILQKITAHTSDVTCCDFTSTFVLITGSSDKTVRLWEWIQGTGYKEKSFSPFLGHKYGVTCLKVSPQNTMLATASIDGTAILWNLYSGARICAMVQIGGNPIRVCRFAPDSSILVTAGDNGAICIWDIIHKSLVKTLFQHEGSTQGLAFTPDSQFLVSACSQEIIQVWSTQALNDTTNEGPCIPLACVINAHDLGILCAEIANNIVTSEVNDFLKYYTLATSANSDDIKIWTITARLSNKKKNAINQMSVDHKETYVGHTSAVTCIKYSHTSNFLISSSLDKTVKIWDNCGLCIATLVGHTRYLNCAVISKDSCIIASGSTGSNDKSIIVWDLIGNLTKESQLNKAHIQLGNCLNISRIQEIQVLRGAEYDNDNFKLIEKIDDISEAAINSCDFCGDDMIVTGSSDKLVRLFKLTESSPTLEEMSISPIDDHSYMINHVEFSRDGSMLATCSLDGHAYIWNPLTGEKISSIPESFLSLKFACFSPDNSTIIIGGDDENASLWDCQTLHKIYTYSSHTDTVSGAAFTPDNKVIVTTCNNGYFHIWYLKSCIYVQHNAHDLGIQGCNFSSNLDPIPNQLSNEAQSYLLATCGNDSLVKLWWISVPKTEEGPAFCKLKVKNWRTMQGHGGNVISVKFSPNTGEIVCSTATDKQARIWSIYSGECLHVLEHDSVTTCCSFSRSSSYLIVGCMDKTLWLWKLPLTLVFQNILAKKLKSIIKKVEHWSTQDVVQWLEDVGLVDIANIVSKTTLDGQMLTSIPEEKICSGLDLDEEHSDQLTKELKWLKSDDLQKDLKSNSMKEVPYEYICPITQEIMLNPVICSDGFTYERKAITEWFMAGKFTSPMTNKQLVNTDFKSNIELRDKIQAYLQNI